jgi:hypothetical protein
VSFLVWYKLGEHIYVGFPAAAKVSLFFDVSPVFSGVCCAEFPVPDVQVDASPGGVEVYVTVAAL